MNYLSFVSDFPNTLADFLGEIMSILKTEYQCDALLDFNTILIYV